MKILDSDHRVALQHNVPLVTHNRRHFERVSDLAQPSSLYCVQDHRLTLDGSISVSANAASEGKRLDISGALLGSNGSLSCS